MRAEVEKFRLFLRARGLKMTRTRELVSRSIFSTRSLHRNAAEIHRKLEARGKHVGLATIYRTLNLLVQSGLVASIDLGEDHSHFEPGGEKTAHGHLICLSCGKVIEFGHDEIKTAIDRIGRERGYRLDKFSIQVFGFCRACAPPKTAGQIPSSAKR